ncbi:MAG TPA: ABC transporter ATP-binding protein [Acidimicrobiales bacterium]|nr:ABC transporter ATP-binding protein [Acidimicrobiales bacterium]
MSTAGAERVGAAAGNDGAPGDRLLEIQNLRTYLKTSRGVVRAVDGVSLELRPGTTLGLVGESGCGKSMLLRSILGLLPRRSVERQGRILFEGQDLLSLPPSRLRRILGRDIGYVAQDPMTSLNPVLKVGQQVGETLRCHYGVSRSKARAEALELLQSVGIPEAERRLDQYPHQLSGGMRQRVSIAAALACHPKLLLADEPTTALDVTVQAQVLELLSRLARERSMAMILVTHDLGVVAGRTEQIAVMYAGQVVELSPTSDLFGNIQMPYTEALFKSIPRLSDVPHHRLVSIPGRPPDLRMQPTGCRFASRCTYTQPQCLTDAPALTEPGTSGHAYACWFPLGLQPEDPPADSAAPTGAPVGPARPARRQ